MDFKAIIALALLAGAYSSPVNLSSSNLRQPSCALQCTGKSKFSYTPGQTYVFSYEAETRTGLSGAAKDHTDLKITTTAEIEVLSKCELALKLKGAEVSGSDPKYPKNYIKDAQNSQFQKDLEKYTLRFSFQDGIVEELCPAVGESIWALNVKRGILSAFQNSMDSFNREENLVETDITGKCRTAYKLIQEGRNLLTVKKTKDMTTCIDRHGYDSSISSSLYSVPSSIQSLPLLKTTHECNQEILNKDGHVKSVVCHEMHLFRPFSKGNSGATTEVMQNLTFVSKTTKSSILMGDVARRESLLFDHTGGEKGGQISEKEATDKLKELCKSTKEGIEADTPKIFSELVMIMKKLDSNALEKVYMTVKQSTFCPKNSERVQKFYMDAIPMVGTASSVKQITQFVMNKDVNGVFSEAWLSSLAFIQHPTKDILSEVSKLINTVHGHRVLLPLSTLVNTFCTENLNCENEKEVSDIIKSFETNLGNDCSSAEEMKILLTLRAIGNTGHAQTVIPTLDKCISRKENSMEIRVSSVEAYRRMSCGADRNNLMIVTRDSDEDAEIRISAYLQVMKCPSDFVIEQIKETLKTENVNQVGSFIWTHLENLKETSSVNKQAIREILQDQDLPKKFDMDVRKFSRNYEWSYFSKALNAGGSVDSNLIWSPESFVPRSAMANLTVDIFGHSVNLLEIGGRAEGLDYLLESYFGPSGYFHDRTNTPKEKESNAIKMKKFDKIDNAFGKNVQELKAAMYMRFFGNEVVYHKFDDSNKNGQTKEFNFLEFFMELRKDHFKDFMRSNVFLDSTIIVPTMVGLPLNLTVNGVSTIDVKTSGKMDLGKPAKSVLIEGSLKPSGAVEVSSVMSVDAFFTKSGLKMTSVLHSSTAIQGKIEIKEKQDFTFEFDVPKDKSEIVNVKSSFFMIYKEVEKEQKLSGSKKIHRNFCSGHTLARVTGMELCGEIDYPSPTQKPDAPLFPLNGPVNVVLTLQKKDTHTGYRFEMKKINNRKMINFKIQYDTPGSKIERTTGALFEVDKSKRTMDISMTSPWKKAKFTGNVIKTNSMNSVTGTVSIDTIYEYRVKAEVGRYAKGSVIRYKPKMEISYPEGDPIKLTGSMEYIKQKTFDADLILTGAKKDPMYLQTTIKYNNKMKGLSFNFTHEKTKSYFTEAMVKIMEKKNRLTLSPKMRVKVLDTEYANLNGNIDYKSEKGVKVDLVLQKVWRNPIILRGRVTTYTKKKRVTYKGSGKFTGPKCNMKVVFSTDRRPKAISGNIKVDYNFARYIKWAKDGFQFNTKLINKSIKKLKKMDLKTEFKSARYSDFNNKLSVIAYNRPNKVAELETVFNFGKTYLSKTNKQRVIFKASSAYTFAKYSSKMNYNVTLKYHPEKVDYALSGNHIHNKKNIVSNAVIHQQGKKTVATAIKFTDESTKLPKYSGSVSLSYKDRDINIGARVLQKSATEYNTKWTIEHQKNQESVIFIKYTRANNISHEVQSNIRLYQIEPISVTASSVLSLQKPSGHINVVHGKSSYAMAASGKVDAGKYIEFSTSLSHPNRKVVIETEGGLKNQGYTGKINVQWDAEKDKDQQVSGEVTTSIVDGREFDCFLSAQFPGRFISANIHHLAKSTKKSSFELAWSPTEKIAAEYELLDNRKNYKGQTRFTVGFSSPFKYFEENKVSLEYIYSKKAFDVSGAVTYAKDRTISLGLITKRPLSFRDVDVSVTMKTPDIQFGNPEVIFKQTFSDDYLVHNGIFGASWGENKFINIETNGISKPYQRYHRETVRNIGFKSSFLGYESLIYNFTHYDDLESFETRAKINHNNEIYLYLFKMNHKINGWQIQNSGSFDIKSRFETMALVWSHIHRDNQVRSSSNIKWGNGQRFNTELTADIQNIPYRRFTADFNMDVPSDSLRRVEARFEHEDKIGYIKTVGTVTADRRNIGTISLNYDRQVGKTDFDASITSVYMEEFRLAGNTMYLTMPNTGFVEVEWAPFQKIRMDVFRNMDAFKNTENRFTLVTPFKQANKIELNLSHKLKGLEYVAQGDFKFAPRQKITVTVNYRLDMEKKVRFSLKTPFPQFSNLDTGVYFKGSAQQFNTNADFKIVPLVGKINAEASWSMQRDTKGMFQLVTPFREFPRLIAEVSSSPSVTGRQSKLMLEYLPTQKIEFESLYTVNGNQLDGSFVFKSPFTGPATIAYKQNGDANAFSSHAEVKYNVNQNIIIDTTFGLQPTVYGTLELVTPIKGFEVAKFGFSHEGKQWKKFRTLAEYSTDGNKVEVETMLDVVTGVSGKVMLKTPFVNLTKAQIAFDHDGNSQNFKTHGEMIFNERSLTGDVSFSHAIALTSGSLKITSSAEQLKLVSMAFNHDGKIHNFKTHGETTLNDRKYESDVTFTHNADITAGTISLKSPVKEWKETVLSFTRDGPADNMKANAKLTYQSQIIEGSLQHKFEANDISIAATLESPYTEKMMMRLNHNTRKRGFTNVFEASMGTDNSVKSQTNYKLRNGNLDFDTEQTITISGEKVTRGVDINHKGDVSDFSTEVNMWNNKQKATVNVKFSGTSWDTTDAAIKINTPHTTYDAMEFSLRNSLSGNDYASEVVAQYTTGKKITATSTFSVALPMIDGTLMITTPFTGYEKLSLGIKNSFDDNNIDSSVAFTGPEQVSLISSINTARYTGTISILRGAQKLFDIRYNERDDGGHEFETNLKYENEIITAQGRCTVNLPTVSCDINLPISLITEAKNLNIAIDNSVQNTLYSTSVEMSIDEKKISAKSFTNLDLPDVSVDLQLDTFVDGFRKNRIEVSKTGGWKNGVSKISITSDNITPINGESALSFDNSMLDFSIKFTSGFSGVEDLEALTRNTWNDNEIENHIEVKLDKDRKITHDFIYKRKVLGNRLFTSSNTWTLTTPFEKVKNLKMINDASKSGNKKSDSMFLEHNSKVLYDFDRSYYINTETHTYNMVYTSREPRKMEFTIDMNKEDQTYKTDINLNWDKLDVNSNLQIKGSVTAANTNDKLNNDISVRAVHPSRTVGLTASLNHDGDNTDSKMTIVWDESKKSMAGYDYNRQGNKNNLKVILPKRSIEVIQEFDNSRPVQWIENSVFWDADGDKSKSASIKFICNKNADFDKKVELKLPVFNKEYSVHSTVKRDTIGVNTQTIISYSSDSMKNIVFSSRLENLISNGGNNQSFYFGVKHPFTNLNVTVYGHKADSRNKQTAGLGIKYLTDRHQRKNLLLLTEINKLRNEMSLNVYGPSKSLGLKGFVQTKTPYKLIMSSMVDGAEANAVEINIDSKKKSIDLQAKYDREHPNSVLYMSGKYPTSNDFEAQVYRGGDFPHVTDSLVSVQLKSSHILHSRIYWRPEMLAESLDYSAQTMKKYASEANKMLAEVGGDIATELASKDSAFSKEFVNEVKPYADAIADQMNNMQSELNNIRRKLKEMQRNNDLYLQDINNIYDNAVQDFIKKYGKAMKSMKKSYTELKQMIEEKSNSIKNYPFNEKYNELVQTASKTMEDYRGKAYKWMTDNVAMLTEKMRQNVKKVQEQIKKLAAQAKKMTQDKINSVIQHPDVVKMKQQFYDLMNKVPVMPDLDIYMTKMQNGLKSGLKQIKFDKRYNEVINKVKQVYSDQYDILMKDKDFTMFKDLVKEFYEELLVRVQYLELQKSLKNFVGGMYKDYSTFVMEDIAQLKVLGLDKSRVIQFDPVNGKIEVELYIPTAMEALNRLPKFPIKKAKSVLMQVKKSVEGVVPKTDFSVWDVYYKYKPVSMNPKDWIPPFKGYAFVAGNRHFVTFDGKRFDFIGDCSFILTRDLVNNNFTVVLNYENEQFKSLLIFAEGKNIEIFTDFSVTVDGQQHDLPYNFQKLTLERKGNQITLDSGRGLKITSDVSNGHHVVEVSGWYFGKLAGLLGTYNNEQFDEMTDAKAQIVSDLGAFSNTWEVSKSCRPVGNKAIKIVRDESDTKFKKCSTLLNLNKSKFRPCFKQVNPELAFTMCLNLDNVCAAASAYIKQCEMAGVSLPLPKECVQCVAPNNEVFNGGESIKVSPSSDDFQVLKSADNVIIIEEKSCNKEPATKLGYLVNKMEEKLIRSGMTNNRYGLVGLDRKGAHSHTLEKEFLNDAKHFLKGVEAMKFTSYKTDTLEAIMHSINYPFRSGVAKNIILVQCGTCTDLKSALYNSIRSMLSTRDIRLHILRDQEFMVGNKSPKQRILGVDNNRKYVLRNTKDSSLDGMTIPVDTCSQLALTSNGSIFDSSGLTLKKMRDRNYFLSAFGTRFSQTAETHECQVCSCVSDETGAPRSVCRKCNTSVSDYLPEWWNNMKHPLSLHQEFEKNFEDYMSANNEWAVFKA